MSAGDLLNDAVGAQQCEQASDTCGVAFLPKPVLCRGEETATKVAVAKPVNGPSPGSDDFQQRGIFLRPGIEGAVSSPCFGHSFEDVFGDFADRTIALHFGQSLKITLVGGPAQLRPAVNIGDSSTKHHPSQRRFGLPLRGAIDPKYLRPVNGSFRAQHAALLVVELD